MLACWGHGLGLPAGNFHLILFVDSISKEDVDREGKGDGGACMGVDDIYGTCTGEHRIG